MTHGRARLLHGGDRLRDVARPGITGKIVQFRFFGCKVAWSDGRVVDYLFRDMRNIEVLDEADHDAA